MPESTRHDRGTVSWVELATTDQPGAKRFYADLFGWTAEDVPMGPDETYSMMKLGGRDVGAISSLRADDRAQGVPSHWRLYLATDAVDDDARRATELGAKLLAPPFDVFDSGRMTVLQDPTGAIVSLWQARRHAGLQTNEEPGAYAWCELQTRSPAAASTFYGALFGWRSEGSPDYAHWMLGDRGIGGMIAIQKDWGDVPPTWLIYFGSSDLDRTVSDAKSRGASVVVPPTKIETGGRWAVLADPQGGVFGAYQKR